MEKYFAILGLRYSASIEDIKIAYKEQIKKWHPDKFPNDIDQQKQATEKSKEINEAYYFLTQYSKDNKPKVEKNKTDDFVWKKVKSSNIHSVGYNESTNTLKIIFLNGRRYEYADVPKAIYTGLMNAQSKGKYAYKYIFSEHKYEYRNF